MSALIYHISSEQAIVATDTLATTIEGRPAFFSSKAFHVPLLRLIIAGTGYWNVITYFADAVKSERLSLRGIEHIAEDAQKVLTHTWAEFRKSNPDAEFTTVYLFGVSEISGEVTAFAFRSPDGFQPERLTPRAGYKPPQGITPPEEFTFEAIPEVMEAMRVEQSKEPDPAKRIHIGGEIQVFSLTPESCDSWVMYRFPDADDHARQMKGEV